MTPGSLQSSVFITLALLSPFLIIPNGSWGFLAFGAFVVLLGIPHGALDTIYALKQFKISGLSGWALFAFGYLLPAALVVLAWKVFPALFLWSFLTISVVHFSGDPARGTPWLARLLYGGSIIFLPFILHSGEVKELFAVLVGPDIAAQMASLLGPLASPWLGGLVGAAVVLIRRNRVTALEFAAMAILSTFAAPLVAFTIFFCSMHSARHILRSYVVAGCPSLVGFIRVALIPMAFVLVLLWVGFKTLEGLTLEQQVVQLVFVSLAALTVPHMGLVERFRFTQLEN